MPSPLEFTSKSAKNIPMKISRSEFDAAASQTSIPSEQSGRLWAQIEANAAQQPRFCAAHVAYYFGALIVISAMGWIRQLDFWMVNAHKLFDFRTCREKPGPN